MFKRILIVNRGEIAVRIIKACRELNIIPIVLFSDADKNSLHVRVADEAYYIGPSTASESYLNIDKIISLVLKINIDAIHPGYGFLSENPEFIRRIKECGIQFIGPSYESVKLMGDKTSARSLMQKNKVPIVPGTTQPIESLTEAKQTALEIGFPVIIKASAGGGGKGMRKVQNIEELEESIKKAQSEAKKAFSNSDVYMEKFIENPKHIEVQIIADNYGNYVHLFERECSIQRRHQKVLEEAPSSVINESLRENITSSAINAAKACNYVNAGTIEFLFDGTSEFYFLEMNTRLQVEHPVTEMITGIDLVKEQIRIADNQHLSFSQNDLKINGHAIECRIYAEDVDNSFAPSIGKILHHRLPSGPGIRVDRGIDILSDISVYYDPMLSKLIIWGANREEAILRMKRALREYQVAGVKTNINLFSWILDHSSFKDSSFNNNFIDKEFLPLVPFKWRKEVSKDYKDVVTILSSFLKAKDINFKASMNCVSNYNEWESQKYE